MRDSTGRPSALLRPAPPRTGLAAFTASGSSKPRRLAGGQKFRALAGPGMMHGAALGGYETGFGLVRRAVVPESDLDDRLLGGCQPLLPLAWPRVQCIGRA